MNEKITNLINSNKIFLFMKGSPEMPQCGFSNKVVEILQEKGVQFSHFDILSDEHMRQAVKEYANWPTYPQLWVNGKLIGGCDIVMQLAQSGELEKALD